MRRAQNKYRRYGRFPIVSMSCLVALTTHKVPITPGKKTNIVMERVVAGRSGMLDTSSTLTFLYCLLNWIGI